MNTKLVVSAARIEDTHHSSLGNIQDDLCSKLVYWGKLNEGGVSG